MKRVDIKIRFACNNMCVFCVQGDKRHRFKDKSLVQIKRELSEGKKDGATGVVFTGGEPTLHKDILKAVEHAKKLKFKTIQVQSNGRMFCYKNFCKELISAGVTEFSPALHGSNATLHDFLTKADGSFTQTVKGIINAKELGAVVITNSVLTEPNREDLPKLAKLLVALDVEQFQFAFVHILGNAMENYKWLVPKKSKLQPFVNKGLEVGISSGKKVMTEAIPLCFMDGYENYAAEFVMPEAVVFDAEYKVKSFKKYRKTQGKIKAPKCKKCKFFKVCEGPWKEYPELFGWSEFKPVK